MGSVFNHSGTTVRNQTSACFEERKGPVCGFSEIVERENWKTRGGGAAGVVGDIGCYDGGEKDNSNR